jgi:hypothetical protein
VSHAERLFITIYFGIGPILDQLQYTGQYILWNFGLAKCPVPLKPEEIEIICANPWDHNIKGKLEMLRERLEVQNITEGTLWLPLSTSLWD